MLYSVSTVEPTYYWGVSYSCSIGEGVVKVNLEGCKIESLHGQTAEQVTRRFIHNKPSYYGVLYHSFNAAKAALLDEGSTSI